MFRPSLKFALASILFAMAAHAVTSYPPGVSDLLFRPGVTPFQYCYLSSPPICIDNPVLNVDALAFASNDGTDEKDQWNIDVSGGASINGGPDLPFDLTGQVTVKFFGLNAGNQFGTFSSEIVDLALSGSVAGHSVDLQLDGSTPTTGTATIDNVGGQPQFHIDSFFDVFTDISLDSGPFFPQSSSVHLQSVYTPEPFAPILVGVGLIVLALSAKRRTR